MSKKDYIAAAASVADIANDETRANVAGTLAGIFAADNSRFDRDVFLRACGVPASTDLLTEARA
jgi:hypothetical protein